MVKNRDNIYHVVRIIMVERDLGTFEIEDMQVVGSYRTHSRAEDVRDAYRQDVIDRKLPEEFLFEVQIGTWYDE